MCNNSREICNRRNTWRMMMNKRWRRRKQWRRLRRPTSPIISNWQQSDATVMNGAWTLATLVTLVAASTVPSPRTVQTHYGTLRGVVEKFDVAGLHPVEKFLGVPYATPPIHGLRFMPPLTPSPWEGIKLVNFYYYEFNFEFPKYNQSIFNY